MGGQGLDTDPDCFDKSWTATHIEDNDIPLLRQAAVDFWAARQDGTQLTRPPPTILAAACDGSAGGVMGAGAAIDDLGTITEVACQVGGETSSFRAEAAVLHLALESIPSS
eukprot:2610303-Rhodomonas_salina.1